MLELIQIKCFLLGCILSIFFYRKWLCYNKAQLFEIKTLGSYRTYTQNLRKTKATPVSLCFVGFKGLGK